MRNVPSHGRALLVANHAGSLFPFDATMMTMAIMKEHPLPRWPRFMVLDWAFVLPVPLGLHAPRAAGSPPAPTTPSACSRQDELVMVFPEGVKGTGKPFSERYRLQRFGRGGFVEIALRTGSPIVPVAVVGSEEIYPKLAESPTLARAIGAPVRADHADLPLARPARPDPAAVALADRVLRADRRLRASGPRRRTTGASSSTSPSRSARRSRTSSTRTSSSEAPPSSRWHIAAGQAQTAVDEATRRGWRRVGELCARRSFAPRSSGRWRRPTPTSGSAR